MIANVAFWYDVGYTDGCIEVPPLNASIGTPDITFENLNPSKGNYFSEFRVPGNYLDLYNVSYLRAIYDMNNASDDLTLYGWVDSVDIQSDTDGYPVTIVKWHIDYWRTFASRADFGSGMIRRRPTNANIPPQDYPHRFIRFSQEDGLFDNIYWVYVTYNEITEFEDESATILSYAFFPVDINEPGKQIIGRLSGNNPFEFPPLNFSNTGMLDEIMDIDPTAITFVGIAPIPPVGMNGSGTEDDPYMPHANILRTHLSDDGNYGIFEYDPEIVEYTDFTEIDPILTTDTEQYSLLTFGGNISLNFPWGIEVDRFRCKIFPTTTSLTLKIYFSNSDTRTVKSICEGTTAIIDCPSLDTNENAWSSYVYSGAREVAVRQLELNTQANLVSGLTNSISSGITGGLMGLSTGMGTGAIGIGAGMGAGAGIAGSLINYAYESAIYNDAMMDINDYAASHQTPQLMLSGTGCTFITDETVFAIVKTVWDDYSIQQRDNDIEMYGCHVSEPMESCQSLIDAGGPLQIDNLVVRGDIPVKAKQYIKQRLANGVRIV